MTEGVGLREFGRLVGVSGEAIRKAIKSERIPAHMVGEKSLSSGRKVPVIADVEGARAAFGANTDPLKKRSGAQISAGKRAANASARGDEAAAEHHRQALSCLNDKDLPSIAESRAKTEAYKAEITKLEYEAKAGKLVDADEFRTKFTAMVATARTRLLGVPSKAKGRIPHLTVDEIAILTELMREALEEVASAR
jgi:phage terminase Nu1 subunit (DNA packaging protein)